VSAADPTAQTTTAQPTTEQTTPGATAAEPAPASYRGVLANRRLAAFVAGDAVSKLGDGMTFVALPVLALQLHGAVSPALAVALVTSAPFLLPVLLSLTYGLGRRRFRPRRILVADCVLRGGMFTALGIAGLAGALRLPEFAAALFVGSVLRTLSISSRRLAATGMVDANGRLAVNGLLGTSDSFASYVVGPALGGLLTALGHAPLILLVDGLTYAVLLIVTAVAVPKTASPAPADPQQPAPADPQQATTADSRRTATASGWAILRRTPTVASLLVLTFLFNMFYGPVEVAVPLLVTASLHAHTAAIGVLWTSFGIGALAGAAATNMLRRVPRIPLLLGIVAGWAGSMVALAVAPNVLVAALALAAGGLIYGPYTAVAYTILLDALHTDEQQPVLTIWTAATTVALPLGLGIGGPLVAGGGARGGLLASAAVTAVLVVFGARRVRARTA
jgi:MFS family permease